MHEGNFEACLMCVFCVSFYILFIPFFLGAKFYRGEQYYLQIDSHSQFIPDWDEKLIQMVRTMCKSNICIYYSITPSLDTGFLIF